MPAWFEIIAALLLFLIGLRLSAFFSGAETGFYRLSLPRLDIESQAGDPQANVLMWFARNPSYFVATCLIGNNVANYVTTAAISWGTLLVIGIATEATEIVATLLMAPVIFQFGELLPKSVYYLAPSQLLRKDIRWFRMFYFAFLIASFPLVLLTRLFERLNSQGEQAVEFVLGRSRLVQLMKYGHEEGVLTDVQSRLASGLLNLAPRPVTSSMIPVTRVLGLAEDAGRNEMIAFARKFGTPILPLHRKGQPEQWFAYVTISDLFKSPKQSPQRRIMPVFNHKQSKLQVLHRLQCEQADYGVVRKDDSVIGIVARNGLIEQIHRPTVAINSAQYA